VLTFGVIVFKEGLAVTKDFYWAISERFGLCLSGDGPEPVAGGDVNQCYRVSSIRGVSYFMKAPQGAAKTSTRVVALLAKGYGWMATFHGGHPSGVLRTS
jgi:fructosamine-3-kinase